MCKECDLKRGLANKYFSILRDVLFFSDRVYCLSEHVFDDLLTNFAFNFTLIVKFSEV